VPHGQRDRPGVLRLQPGAVPQVDRGHQVTSWLFRSSSRGIAYAGGVRRAFLLATVALLSCSREVGAHLAAQAGTGGRGGSAGAAGDGGSSRMAGGEGGASGGAGGGAGSGGSGGTTGTGGERGVGGSGGAGGVADGGSGGAGGAIACPPVDVWMDFD